MLLINYVFLLYKNVFLNIRHYFEFNLACVDISNVLQQVMGSCPKILAFWGVFISQKWSFSVGYALCAIVLFCKRCCWSGMQQEKLLQLMILFPIHILGYGGSLTGGESHVSDTHFFSLFPCCLPSSSYTLFFQFASLTRLTVLPGPSPCHSLSLCFSQVWLHVFPSYDFPSDVKCVSQPLHCVRNSLAVTVANFINRLWPKISMRHSVWRCFWGQMDDLAEGLWYRLQLHLNVYVKL